MQLAGFSGGFLYNCLLRRLVFSPGTNRGQADGFDLETLGKLEGIKDAAGKDIRQLIFDVFLNRMPEQSIQFIEELTPCMVNMRLGDDSG